MEDTPPYLLLTPGPLTTSPAVKASMLRDYCTWDDEYNQIGNWIRKELVVLATTTPADHTCVLLQGSGSFGVEAMLGTVIPRQGKVLVVNNGAYGARMITMCQRLQIDCHRLDLPETVAVSPEQIATLLHQDPAISHVALVHCETTTGLLNPVAEVGAVTKEYGRKFLVDAMSSLGGIPLTMEALHADFLVSSANKCIQGVPGFCFVIARQEELAATAGQARSLCLDLYDQWQEMEHKQGKWRYTSPTQVVRGFATALQELLNEGGVAARYARYQENHRVLVSGLSQQGLRPLLPPEIQSPIITSFLYPQDPTFQFTTLYESLKRRGFVIYPGKISHADTFRIGNIGHVFPHDMQALVAAVAAVFAEQSWRV